MKFFCIAAVCSLSAGFLLGRDPTIAGSHQFTGSASVQRQSRVVSRPDRIEVKHCRVRLIDEAIISADRAGILDFVVPRAGESVRSGALVAQIRDQVVRATLAIAERSAANDVEIRFSRKASELAQLQYLSSVQANKLQPGTFTDFQMRELRLAAEKSLLQLEQAEYNFDVEKLKRDETLEILKTYRVEAPFAGVIRSVHKKKGEAVHEGEPILEIVNARRVQVEGYLSIQEHVRVPRGASVEVRLDLPNIDLEIEKLVFPGRITFVDVKVEPVTQKVKVHAEVDNSQDVLKDGLTARMSIVPGETVAAAEGR